MADLNQRNGGESVDTDLSCEAVESRFGRFLAIVLLIIAVAAWWPTLKGFM